MTVTSSTVKTISDTPIKSENGLVQLTTFSGYKTVVPSGAFREGDSIIWIGSGTTVQKRSPIRKIIRSSIVKKRTICGVESEGLAYPFVESMFEDKYPTEFEICRRYYLLPEQTQTVNRFVRPVITEMKPDKKFDWLEHARIAPTKFFTAYEHESLHQFLAKASSEDFSFLKDGRVEILPVGDVFVMTHREYKGSVYSWSPVKGYEGLSVCGAYQSGVGASYTAMEGMMLKSDAWTADDMKKVQDDREALHKFLCQNRQIALTFIRTDSGKYFLYGGTPSYSNITIPSSKITNRINDLADGKMSDLLINPLLTLHNLHGHDPVKATKEMIKYETEQAQDARASLGYLTKLQTMSEDVTVKNAMAYHAWCVSRCLTTGWYKENFLIPYRVRAILFKKRLNKTNKGNEGGKEIMIIPSESRYIYPYTDSRI